MSFFSLKGKYNNYTPPLPIAKSIGPRIDNITNLKKNSLHTYKNVNPN